MSKRDVFIVMLDTEPTDKKVSRGWLLSLQPMTTKDALWRMSWQRGGHMAGDPDLHMILAKASEFTGIMEHTHTRRHHPDPIVPLRMGWFYPTLTMTYIHPYPFLNE